MSNQPVMFSVVEAALDENNYGALTLLQEEAIPLQNRLVAALDNMTTPAARGQRSGTRQDLRPPTRPPAT